MTSYVQTPDRAGASEHSRTLIVIYAALAVLGTVLPYAYFVPFVQAHGLDLIPNFTVGLSLALPLFLMWREAKLVAIKTEAAS